MKTICETTKMIVALKHEMIDRINKAVQAFEQETLMIVSNLRINSERRKTQMQFSGQYPNALETDDVEIQLIEFVIQYRPNNGVNRT